MDIVLKKKFDLETRNNGELEERFYQDKLLIPSVIFAIIHKKAACRYSKIFKYINPSVYLIIVKDEKYVQIWYEKKELAHSKKWTENPQAKDLPNEVENVTSKDISIDKEFIEVCQKLLMDYIGPFSKILIKKKAAKQPRLSRNDFVLSLISEIIDKPNSKELVSKLEKLLS